MNFTEDLFQTTEGGKFIFNDENNKENILHYFTTVLIILLSSKVDNNSFIQTSCLGYNTLTDQVVDDVSKCPDERDSEERNTKKNNVQHNGQEQIGEPNPSAVHHPCVRVNLAVSYTHIHPESRERPNVRVQSCTIQFRFMM